MNPNFSFQQPQQAQPTTVNVQAVIQQSVNTYNNLIKSMDSFEQNMQGWSDSKVDKFKKMKAEQTQLVQSSQNNINVLQAKVEKATEKRAQDEANNQQHFQLEEAFSVHIRDKELYESSLPEKQEDRLQYNKKLQLDCKDKAMDNKEKDHRYKMEGAEDARVVELFKNNTGMVFDKRVENELQVSFTTLRDAANNFSFVIVHVDGSGFYTVMKCFPVVPYDDLVRDLNETNNFHRFVIMIRSRMKQYLKK